MFLGSPLKPQIVLMKKNVGLTLEIYTHTHTHTHTHSHTHFTHDWNVKVQAGQGLSVLLSDLGTSLCIGDQRDINQFHRSNGQLTTSDGTDRWFNRKRNRHVEFEQ